MGWRCECLSLWGIRKARKLPLVLRPSHASRRRWSGIGMRTNQERRTAGSSPAHSTQHIPHRLTSYPSIHIHIHQPNPPPLTPPPQPSIMIDRDGKSQSGWMATRGPPAYCRQIMTLDAFHYLENARPMDFHRRGGSTPHLQPAHHRIFSPLITPDNFLQRRSRMAVKADPDDDGPQRQDRPLKLSFNPVCWGKLA